MRKYYVDNLRWIAVLLLIPYHAAQAWNVWNEPNYIFFEGNKILSSIVVFFSPYFMPLLFLLAGMSTGFALQKRTKRQYISERCRRLLPPFVSGTLLFMPIMTFIADKFNFAYNGRFVSHYRIFFTKFTDLTGADGGFSVGQFWFILYLFVISLLSIGIISLLKRLTPTPAKDIPLWVICLLGLPLPLCSELLSVGGKSLVEYTYIFLLGYYIFSSDSVIEKIEKHKWMFLITGLAAAGLNVYLFIWADKTYPILNSAAKFISEWFMLTALLGIGKGCLNFRSGLTKYMSSRSFPFYIWHFIWVVLFQYLFADVFSHCTALLYTIPVLLSYAASFFCCEICVRVPPLRLLMGMKAMHSDENIKPFHIAE